MSNFIKLKDLDGEVMKIEVVYPPQWIRWDAENKKMERSDTPKKDFRKNWNVVTDKGTVGISEWQMKDLLSLAEYQGKVDLIGKSFRVKTNGETGMEIRYYFNLISAPQITVQQVQDTFPGAHEVPNEGAKEQPSPFTTA